MSQAVFRKYLIYLLTRQNWSYILGTIEMRTWIKAYVDHIGFFTKSPALVLNYFSWFLWSNWYWIPWKFLKFTPRYGILMTLFILSQVNHNDNQLSSKHCIITTYLWLLSNISTKHEVLKVLITHSFYSKGFSQIKQRLLKMFSMSNVILKS